MPHHNILDLSYISSYNQLSYVLYRHHNILYPIIYPSFLLEPRPLCPNLLNSLFFFQNPKRFLVFVPLQTIKHWGLDPNIEVWTQTLRFGPKLGRHEILPCLDQVVLKSRHDYLNWWLLWDSEPSTSGEFQVIPFLCPDPSCSKPLSGQVTTLPKPEVFWTFWVPLLHHYLGWPWRGKGRYNLKGFILCVRYKKWSTNSFGECLGDSLGLRIAWSDGMDGLLWFLWLFQSCHSWWNLRKRIRFGKNNQSEHAGILVDTLRFLFTLVRTPCILHPVLFLEVWAGTSKRDIQHLWSS